MDGKNDDGKDGEIMVTEESDTKNTLPSRRTKTWHSEPPGQTFH